ncbi:PREDICTED: uncharacterized protein LOC104589883 [Nelumbo nucifera]|uniref:Uncharacterized protein LOC104589883 n=2 Tax=Nelumbo nucifera TaxID=4432 RepID=A0A1U7ZF37_NELNU|nr:PREDICTED: uncharacterized protein LOC104589883 [Nelumbo nucifera]XP_010246637.1 PREDICTED: uncharacterized protein LOC104589883 [Nelumbo nucifera]DAD43637.1 TPA_asm: hypothetical protein HUJ06_001867 [Nelumbo nucifera]DAD43642.1 TPA_asm: hypothetical protein HUJ06_001872 [Nelumbo nucifera]
MASACVNNIGISPDNFLDCPPTYPSYGWLSPRISFSRDFADEEAKIAAGKTPSPGEKPVKPLEKVDPETSGMDIGDFEFRLDDPVTMLPADELFSDGKLVPLQLTTMRPAVASTTSAEVRSPDTAKSRRRDEVSCTDPYLFSPKAPRCSSRWKELLGLKKLQSHQPKQEVQKVTSSFPSKISNARSLKHFLHRNPKSSSSLAGDSSLSLPLLRDSDSESVSISSRLSLSSSSSGPDHEDLPRLSLDAEKPNPSQVFRNPPRVRLVKPTRPACDNPRPFTLDHPPARVGRSPIRRAPDSTTIPARGVSVDSPRMNSSGKIVFQSLERSSSSPSSFNGGPKIKHRGMERSYSANVRVTPVLNVPVCSLRGSSKSGSVFGFGQLFSSPQKRDGGSTARTHTTTTTINNRNRNDRN